MNGKTTNHGENKMEINNDTIKGMNIDRETVATIFKAVRTFNSLKAKGVEVNRVQHHHYYNMKFDGYGRLQNGMVRRSYRTEVSGKTFGIKEVLKAAGYRWDASKKVWWSSEVMDAFLAGQLIRAMA